MSAFQLLDEVLASVDRQSDAVEFMFMGTVNGIHLFKHYETRHYLNVNECGTTFAYRNGEFVWQAIENAIAHAFSWE